MTNQKKVLEWKPIAWLVCQSRKIVLPGFNGIPLYDVARFFFKGLLEGHITSRASAISFRFFLALFPSLIFFFTIIPFVPIANFQQALMDLMREMLPETTYGVVQSTMEDIITRPRGGLLSVGFVLSLYFSTNGIHSMIEAFNITVHTMETRSFLKQRLVSLFLFVVIALHMIVAIGLISAGTWGLKFLFEGQALVLGALVVFKWLITIAALFFVVSFIYYFAPAQRRQFRFMSAGSSLATLLIIATTLGLNVYVKNFSSYNALYGSIGTLLIVLLWIYFLSFSMLIGFELNASILQIKRRNAEQRLRSA